MPNNSITQFRIISGPSYNSSCVINTGSSYGHYAPRQTSYGTSPTLSVHQQPSISSAFSTMGAMPANTNMSNVMR
jgi:hypothetical protein